MADGVRFQADYVPVVGHCGLMGGHHDLQVLLA